MSRGLLGRQAEVTPGQAAAAGADLVRDLPQRERGRGVGVDPQDPAPLRDRLRVATGPEEGEPEVQPDEAALRVLTREAVEGQLLSRERRRADFRR